MSDTAIRGRGELRSVTSLLSELDEHLERGDADDLVPIPTGFSPLDRVLGGGLHPGALTIVGGAPGVGKTILGLQWARHIALSGRHAIYACYEHEESELLLRIVAMELAELDPDGAEQLHDDVAASAATAGNGLRQILGKADVGEEVLARIDAYAARLHIVRASGAHTGLADLEAHVQAMGIHRPVLFVDYLQKVNIVPEPANEAEKVTRVSEGLKDLALTERIPVVAIAATDLAGLKTRRVRMHHFRGSSALAFEADVAIVMNDKFDAVSKVHLAYDPVRAGTFHDWVVMTIEKNRGGPNLIDLEFRKDFPRYRFHSIGGMVEDRLMDDRFESD